MPGRIDEAKVSKYSKTLENYLKASSSLNETNTRRKLIEPLIDLLGWDSRSDDVDYEYVVDVGSKASYVDYALMLEHKPIAFIEAKPLESDLGEDYSKQTISYGRVEGIRWVALTNGKHLKIFDAKVGKTEHEAIICDIDLTNPTKYLEELNLLHKESLSTGETASIAENINRNRITIHKLKEEQNNLAEAYAKAITSITGVNNLNNLTDITHKLASYTLDLFERKVTQTTTPPPQIKPSPPPTKNEAKDNSWDALLRWVSPESKKLTLAVKDEIVSNFSNSYHKPSGSDYVFSKSAKGANSTFAALCLRKNGLKIRVRFDPASSSDPNHLLTEKVYKGWFFKGRGQERELFIDRPEHITQAMVLVKQSYQLASS